MMTWSDYYLYKFMGFVGGAVVLVVFAILATISDGSYCKGCHRRKQFRWKKPHHYATRWFCPFHDHEDL